MEKGFNNTYSPEESRTTDVANIRVGAKALAEQFRQSSTLCFDILQHVLFLDDFLNLKASCASKRIVLEGVTVTESAGARTMLEGIVNLWADEHGGELLEATGETLADSLDVGCNIVFLPCMKVAGSAHSTHDFVEDK